jgi:hypothetical protein
MYTFMFPARRRSSLDYDQDASPGNQGPAGSWPGGAQQGRPVQYQARGPTAIAEGQAVRRALRWHVARPSQPQSASLDLGGAAPAGGSGRQCPATRSQRPPSPPREFVRITCPWNRPGILPWKFGFNSPVEFAQGVRGIGLDAASFAPGES